MYVLLQYGPFNKNVTMTEKITSVISNKNISIFHNIMLNKTLIILNMIS